MPRLALWFSDHDTYEMLSDGAIITELSDEGAELISNGTTLKKMTDAERDRYVLTVVGVEELLKYFMAGHPDFLQGPEKATPKPITIVVVRPGEPPKEEQMVPTLDAMQALVGGMVQDVPYGDGLSLMCNEEGKQQNLPYNRPIFGGRDVAVGTIFFCRTGDKGETVGVTRKDVKRIMKEFP